MANSTARLDQMVAELETLQHQVATLKRDVEAERSVLRQITAMSTAVVAANPALLTPEPDLHTDLLHPALLLSPIALYDHCHAELQSHCAALLGSFATTPYSLGVAYSEDDATSARALAGIVQTFVRVACDRSRHAVVFKRRTVEKGVPEDVARGFEERLEIEKERYRGEVQRCVEEILAQLVGEAEDGGDDGVGIGGAGGRDGGATDVPNYDPVFTTAWAALHRLLRAYEGYHRMLQTESLMLVERFPEQAARMLADLEALSTTTGGCE